MCLSICLSFSVSIRLTSRELQGIQSAISRECVHRASASFLPSRPAAWCWHVGTQSRCLSAFQKITTEPDRLGHGYTTLLNCNAVKTGTSERAGYTAIFSSRCSFEAKSWHDKEHCTRLDIEQCRRWDSARLRAGILADMHLYLLATSISR